MYEVITDDGGIVTIKKTEADGRELWIPEDAGNRHYQEHLRYTAWVDAGNDPEDFWNQDAL